MRLREIIAESTDGMWNDKHVVQQVGEFRIVVDKLGSASYVTVWSPDNRKIGSLTTGGEKKGYLRIGTAGVDRAYRGKGLGKAMYLALLANLDQQYQGVVSHLPDRENRLQVPAIYKRLGGYVMKDNSDYMIIPRLVESLH
jgi:ribosomal protein S18 acetylase RimI-like enzyme